MAASTSKQAESKDPPQKDSQTSASRKGRGKGKEKENNSEPTLTSGPSYWQHDTPWNWTSLTNPCSNKIPPIFTRDGRCVLQGFRPLPC